MTDPTPPHRRRLDLAAPLAPTPDTYTGPATWERLAVGFGVWILPLFNTVLLIVLLFRVG